MRSGVGETELDLDLHHGRHGGEGRLGFGVAIGIGREADAVGLGVRGTRQRVEKGVGVGGAVGLWLEWMRR